MPLNLSTPGLSYWSIPALWLTTFVPVGMKIRALDNTAVGYDTVQPRANVERAASSRDTVPSDTAARIARIEGAHLNGNEMMPIWIGAVLAGNQVGINHKTMNTIAATFLGMRVLYNYVYITQTTKTQGNIRTFVWLSGLALPMFLYFKAGQLLKNAAIYY